MASDSSSETTAADGASSIEIPPGAIDLATRMYNAAREGQMDIFEAALPAGLPPNLTNDKGDTLVGRRVKSKKTIIVIP